jgi:hypothetical protein
MDKKEIPSRDEMCAICLQEKVGALTKLRCGHEFHGDCVQQWFISSRTRSCPICRTPDGEENSQDLPPRVAIDEQEVEWDDFTSSDYALNELFTSFDTEDGNVFVYETPTGIIMITTTADMTRPRGLRMIAAIPVPPRQRTPTTTAVSNMRRPSRWRQFFRNMFSCFRRRGRLSDRFISHFDL